MELLALPTVNKATVQRREELVANLQKLMPLGRVVHDEHGRRIYAFDAFGAYRAMPLAVVLPSDVREVARVLRYCYEAGIKVFPRGAGTSLTGGAVGTEDGIVLCLSRMTRVLAIDEANRLVRVEAGVTTAAVSRAVAAKGFFYAPDPCSAEASTIGGNIATNAAGARGLIYGATGQHVLAVKIVLCDGEVIDIGGGELEPSGYDLIGLIAGSEGLLGVVVEAALRILPVPEARQLSVIGFESVSAALTCAAGLMSAAVPASAIEVIDRDVVSVCERFADADLPRAAGALLLCETEGHPDEFEWAAGAIDQVAQFHGPTFTQHVSALEEVGKIWRAHHAAIAALGRLGDVKCVDVAVPASRLHDAMALLGEIAARYGLRGANMFRAGDGIVRSVLLCGGETDEGHLSSAIDDVAQMVTGLGGVIAGEHGIGAFKREVIRHQHADASLGLQMRLKSAFDTEWLLNHGKVFPLAEQAALSSQ